MAHKWNRPDLPADNRGAGLPAGWLLIALGGVLGMLAGAGMTDPDSPLGGPLMIAVSVGCLSLGMVIVPVSMVLREIRHAAFESALRAGEVVTITADQATDPYQQFLDREQAAGDGSGAEA